MKTATIISALAIAASAASSSTAASSSSSANGSSKPSTRNELMFVSDAPTVLSWSVMPKSPYISFSLSEAVNNGCVVTLSEDVLSQYDASHLQTVESNSIAVRLSFVHKEEESESNGELSHTYIFFRPLSCYKEQMNRGTAKFDDKTKTIAVNFDAAQVDLEAYPGDGIVYTTNVYTQPDAVASSVSDRVTVGTEARAKETLTIDVDETIASENLQSFSIITDLLNGLRGSTTTTTPKP